MNRRDFFKTIMAGGVALVVPSTRTIIDLNPQARPIPSTLHNSYGVVLLDEYMTNIKLRRSGPLPQYHHVWRHGLDDAPWLEIRMTRDHGPAFFFTGEPVPANPEQTFQAHLSFEAT